MDDRNCFCDKSGVTFLTCSSAVPWMLLQTPRPYSGVPVVWLPHVRRAWWTCLYTHIILHDVVHWHVHPRCHSVCPCPQKPLPQFQTHVQTLCGLPNQERCFWYGQEKLLELPNIVKDLRRERASGGTIVSGCETRKLTDRRTTGSQ